MWNAYNSYTLSPKTFKNLQVFTKPKEHTEYNAYY